MLFPPCWSSKFMYLYMKCVANMAYWDSSCVASVRRSEQVVISTVSLHYCHVTPIVRSDHKYHTQAVYCPVPLILSMLDFILVPNLNVEQSYSLLPYRRMHCTWSAWPHCMAYCRGIAWWEAKAPDNGLHFQQNLGDAQFLAPSRYDLVKFYCTCSAVYNFKLQGSLLFWLCTALPTSHTETTCTLQGVTAGNE